MKKPTVREIIDQNHFDTIYEPIVVVENTQIFGYESLTRLKTDHWNAISDFIEEAEQDGLQKAFELLTLHNAVKRFNKSGDTPLFVNISYDTFLENQEELHDTLLDNGKIVFEFLETSKLPQERMNDLEKQLLQFQEKTTKLNLLLMILAPVMRTCIAFLRTILILSKPIAYYYEIYLRAMAKKNLL